MQKRLWILLILAAIAFAAPVFAQDPLGDSDSFGTNVKFQGSVASGTIYFSQNCLTLPVVLDANDRCLNVAGPVQITKDFKDIGKIVLPPNSFQNTIYPLVKNNGSLYVYNPSPATSLGYYFNYRPYLTLESPALSDPSLINPLTGQPFGGKVDIGLPNKEMMNTIVGGGSYLQTDNFTTVLTNGVTKRYLMQTYGLNQTVADAIFANKLVIRLNCRVSVQSLTDGFVQYSIRFLGN